MPKIFAFLNGHAVGDFTIAAVMASSIRELFDEGELFVYYRDNRPYKKHIASCIRNLNGTFTSPPDPNATFALDYFDPFGDRIGLGPPGSPPSKLFEDNKLKDTDLVLCGTMLNERAINSIPTVPLRPPPELVENSNKALLALGVDPQKWVACVYWKEAGYKFRWNDPKRVISDPAPYIQVIRHIVENLGGQVIRLGHPTPTVIPKLPGVLDLAKIENSEWLQLYAVTIARFFLGTGSGPGAYGPAFRVPTVLTDLNYCLGAWNPQDYIVTQGISYNGKVFRQTDAFDAGYLSQDWKPDKDYRLIRNTAAELVAAADEMFKSTANCTVWREPQEFKPKRPRPNIVNFPIPRREARKLLVPPSRR